MGDNVAVIMQKKSFRSLSIILLKSPISLASFLIGKTFLSDNRSAIDSGFGSGSGFGRGLIKFFVKKNHNLFLTRDYILFYC